MAVRQRGKGGEGYKSYSSRLPAEVYNDLNEWAWENRLTLSAACAVLIQKALTAERGADYKRGIAPAIAGED